MAVNFALACLQVKPAAVTGVVSQQEIWNFPLKAEDTSRYDHVVALRSVELLDLANLGHHTLGQILRRPSAAGTTEESSAPPVEGTTAKGSEAAAQQATVAAPGTGSRTSRQEGEEPADSRTGSLSGGASSAGGNPGGPGSAGLPGATAAAAPPSGGGKSGGGSGAVAADLVEALAAGRGVAAERLLYDELEVTTPARKLTQAQLYGRMARDLKAR